MAAGNGWGMRPSVSGGPYRPGRSRQAETARPRTRACTGQPSRPERDRASEPRRWRGHAGRSAAIAAALLGFGLVARLPAAFLRNVPIELRQPNGAVVNVLVTGDEYSRNVHDARGYTILRHPETGWYTYAAIRAGRVAASDYPVGSVDPASLGIPPGLRQEIDRLPEFERRQDIEEAPRTGAINNIVIFIRFSGETEFGLSVSAYDTMFNSAAAGVNSMRNYFQEASYDALAISTTFYPSPASSMVVSYQDSHARGYFSPYSVTNTIGYANMSERTSREHALLRDAVNHVNSLAQIPPGLVVDGDGDGLVDNICFIVRGSPDGWSDLLWPHKWSLYTTPFVYINAKRVYTYNLQLQSTTDTGVLCHEMFHSIGAPDLYRYSGSYVPVGPWDIMAYDANPPQHMGAVMKQKYGTWIAALPEITASGTYILNPLTSTTGQCFKIRSPRSAGEYFVVEYRRKTGVYESSVPASGLIVQRINSACNGNADGPPDEIYVYRPNGTLAANGSYNEASFTSDAARTAINDSTNPTSFLSTGAAGGLDISDVGTCGATISFRVTVPAITVTSPNGGQSWVGLSTHDITWAAIGPSFDNVKLEYTLNNGSAWTTITDSTPNDGRHPWMLPAAPTTQARIRITNVFGFPTDQSDAAFTILTAPVPPAVTTAAVTDIAAFSARSGGDVASDGGAAVTARGVCWNTTGSPTIADAKTADGSGTGAFTSTLTGLTPGQTYCVRAYATNVAGIAYGGQVVFAALQYTLPYTQGFAAGSLPIDWAQQAIGVGITPRWAFPMSDVAGGVPGEARCGYEAVSPGTTRLVLPPLRTVGSATIYLTFRHYLDAGIATPGAAVLTVQSSPDTTTWTGEAWQLDCARGNPPVNVGPEAVTVPITHNTNAAATYLAFVVTGNLDVFDFWYVDDVSVTAAPPVSVATVTTAAVTASTWTTAAGGGDVTADGGAAVTVRGVCWNTAPNPTTANSKTTDGTGTGVFASSLTGLSPGTLYYVRAYATNSAGTAYGNQVSFTTAAVTLPAVTTAAITSITRTTAAGGGNVTSSGGAAVSSRGVCWNTAGSPTIADAKTSDGTGTGAFISTLAGLAENTTYYVRAYAVNSAGTAYGGPTTFTSLPPASPPYEEILPEVIWAEATGGGTWASEVQITDRTGGSQVSAYFSSSAGRRGPVHVWTGPGADRSVKFPNFLAALESLDGGFAYFGQVGAVQFVTQDADHEIRVSARTVNGDYGKTFQGRPPAKAELADIDRSMMIQNLANNAAYRSAAGFFNPTAEEVTAEFTLHGPDGPIGKSFTQRFAAHGFMNFMVFDEAGLPYPEWSHDHAWLLVRPVEGAGALMCFGATANNATNDPSAHAAVQLEPGFVNSPSAGQVLPEVIWARATGGGTWVSEVQVTDLTGGSAVSVTVSTSAGARGPFLLWTGPAADRSVRFANLLQAIDGLDAEAFDYYGRVGAVRFETQDDGHRIHVSARTVNGNYGKTFQGLNDVPENRAEAGGLMMIPDVISNEAYRSAAGFLNTGGGEVRVEFEIFGAAGRIGSPFTKAIPAGGFVSFMVFDEAGAPYPGDSHDNAWLSIRATSGTGGVLCFGATANNRTNDPSAHGAVRY